MSNTLAAFETMFNTWISEGRVKYCTVETVKYISVFDVLRMVLDVNTIKAIRRFRCLLIENPELHDFVKYYKFEKYGERQTPVTTTTGVAFLIFLLPGKKAETFKRLAAKTVARFLSGDKTLIPEIEDIDTMHTVNKTAVLPPDADVEGPLTVSEYLKVVKRTQFTGKEALKRIAAKAHELCCQRYQCFINKDPLEIAYKKKDFGLIDRAVLEDESDINTDPDETESDMDRQCRSSDFSEDFEKEELPDTPPPVFLPREDVSE